MPGEGVSAKIVDDAYEFLHFVEVGRSSMQELSEIFSQSGNKAESDYRQVERIKQRCIRLGIHLEFDPITMRFKTERNAKLKYLDRVLPRLQERRREVRAFGFYAEKLGPNAAPEQEEEVGE